MFFKKILKVFFKILLNKFNLKLIRSKYNFFCKQKVIDDSFLIYQNYLAKGIEKKTTFKRLFFIVMGSNQGERFDLFSKYFSYEEKGKNEAWKKNLKIYLGDKAK